MTMFCPQCKAEYRVGFVRCSDCHVELVDHLPVEEPARAPKARRMFDVDPFAPEPELVVIRTYQIVLDNSKSCSPVLIDVPVSSLGFAAISSDACRIGCNCRGQLVC